MLVKTAMTLIEQVRYKPGWTIEVKDHTNRFEDAICVTMCADTFATERQAAEQGYPDPVRPRASFCILVGEFHTHEELYRALLQKIIDYETHEAREFFRILPTHWAPFHPHHKDGMERWGTPELDLAYGMV